MEYSEHIKRYGIGLTGGVATGKSTVAKILRSLGYDVFDADQLARQAVAVGSVGLAEVVDHFGALILNDDGTLNRRKLAEIIFNDKDQKRKLEEIIHPRIHTILSKKLDEAKLINSQKFWFYEAALLLDTGVYRKFREVWLTYCSPEEQLRRLTSRNRYPVEFARKIISNQMSASEKGKLADFVINTETPLAELKPKVEEALKRLYR